MHPLGLIYFVSYKQRHYFANKDPYSQSYGFSSSHVWMWELDHKDSWTPKNQCFWTVVLKKTLESPLDSKEIKLVHPKGNQSWMFIGRTDAEAEAPILRPPDAKILLIGKDPDAGKDWRQEEMGMTEDEMVGWHDWLYRDEFEVSSGSWCWTGKPGVLQSMESQTVVHDWAAELNWLQCSEPHKMPEAKVGWSSWNYKRTKICLKLITAKVGWWHSGARYTIPATFVQVWSF